MSYAGVLLVTHNNELILQQRDDNPNIVNPGMVTTFGGSIEEGESPKEAALREIDEELSLKLSDISYLGKFVKQKEIHSEDMECYIFTAKEIDPEKLELKEGKGFVFLDKSTLLKNLNLSKLAKEIVQYYFETENK